MNVTYKLIFKNRIENKIPPYYYIGSKSKCTIIENIIYDKNNKPYWSSSKNELFIQALKEEIPKVEILFTSENYQDAYSKEVELLNLNKVRTNIEFFNILQPNLEQFKFVSGDYISVRHIEFPYIKKRILKNSDEFFSGDWVGITKGLTAFRDKETKQILMLDAKDFRRKDERYEFVSPKLYGDKNGFYGKHHSEETKEILSKIFKEREKNLTEKERKERSNRQSKAVKGSKKPDSWKEEAKKWLSKYRGIKNPKTGETKSVLRNSAEHKDYLKNGWVDQSSGRVTLLSPDKSLSKTINKNSDEYLELITNGWISRKLGKIILTSPDGIGKEFEKNSEEYLNAINTGWVSSTKGRVTLINPTTLESKAVKKGSEEYEKLINSGMVSRSSLMVWFRNINTGIRKRPVKNTKEYLELLNSEEWSLLK